jgi:hypothetical protein
MADNIVWKDVPIEEFKNSYEVSNNGEIRNKKTLKIKATQPGSTGYVTTRLDNGTNKKTVQLHSLVADAFIKPIESKENKKIVVKFKDGDKSNINVDNLSLEYQNMKISNKKQDNDDNPNNIINNNNNQNNNDIQENLNNEITINNFKGKKISNYPDYLVSKEGQVYSTKSNKIKIAEINQTGYCRIEILNTIGKKKFYIHRLVAEAYIPNPNNYDQVNHKDLNKHNNKVENLEWCNGAMNMKHNADNKPDNSRIVNQFDLLDETKIIGTYNSIKEASEKTQINNTSIIHCCSGKYKKAGGYIWKYAN